MGRAHSRPEPARQMYGVSRIVDSELVQLRIVRMSTGKSASLQQIGRSLHGAFLGPGAIGQPGGITSGLPSLGNNTQIPAKDRSELRSTFEHGVHSVITTLSFTAPTASLAIGTPLLFASAEWCVLYSMILRHVFYTVHILNGAKGPRAWSVQVRNRSLVQGRQ
jgi:hypothetical protein